MQIKQYKDELKEAFDLIKKFQSGEQIPIKTRLKHFNDNSLGGIYNGNIITIAAISGMGKSYLLQLLEKDMFNPSLNPLCNEYALLRCNWEMSPFKLVLRSLKNKTQKKPSELLFNKPSKELGLVYNEVYKEEGHPNIYSSSIPSDPVSFYNAVKSFLQEHEDKVSVGITIDHLALVKDGGNKKKSMDDLTENMNKLRMEFKNVFFIILSQLNREIEKRTNPNELAPNRGDLYMSDNLYQLSDLVLCLHNPYKLGHNKYMVVPPDRYPHLTEYMVNPEAKTVTNFDTKGVLFYHYLKIREADQANDVASTLFIEKI